MEEKRWWCGAEAGGAPGDFSSSSACRVQLPLKVFARSPEARHLSLQDRKRALFDYARR